MPSCQIFHVLPTTLFVAIFSRYAERSACQFQISGNSTIPVNYRREKLKMGRCVSFQGGFFTTQVLIRLTQKLFDVSAFRSWMFF